MSRKPPTSVYADLEALVEYIENEKYLDDAECGYCGGQRVIAYTRVLNRLKPILRKATRLRMAFDFEIPV